MGLQVPAQQGVYQFDGPHTNTGSLRSQSGVYVISTIVNGVHRILDIGESENIRYRIENHDRKESWTHHMVDTVYASALYCNAAQRMALEGHLRLTHNPPCGIR